MGAWRLEEAAQPASVDTAVAAPPKVGGLPRPVDYDDYWYEGEDGLWYNEYDDELEEGQYYEEVPEEDGYPKPDLTAVEEGGVAAVVEEAAIPEVVQPLPSRPEEKQPRQRKESQTDIDPDLRAAQEAAKAASDAAKNLLGGAMSFGGGFLGGLGGGASGGKTQQKTGVGGFGLGGFGLGGMMGGGAPAAKPATATSAAKPKPVMKKQEAVVEPTVPIHKDEPASAPGEPRPIGQPTNELQESEMQGRKSSNAEIISTEELSHEDGTAHISVAEDSSTKTVTKNESLDSKSRSNLRRPVGRRRRRRHAACCRSAPRRSGTSTAPAPCGPRRSGSGPSTGSSRTWR